MDGPLYLETYLIFLLFPDLLQRKKKLHTLEAFTNDVTWAEPFAASVDLGRQFLDRVLQKKIKLEQPADRGDSDSDDAVNSEVEVCETSPCQSELKTGSLENEPAAGASPESDQKATDCADSDSDDDVNSEVEICETPPCQSELKTVSLENEPAPGDSPESDQKAADNGDPDHDVASVSETEFSESPQLTVQISENQVPGQSELKAGSLENEPAPGGSPESDEQGVVRSDPGSIAEGGWDSEEHAALSAGDFQKSSSSKNLVSGQCMLKACSSVRVENPGSDIVLHVNEKEPAPSKSEVGDEKEMLVDKSDGFDVAVGSEKFVPPSPGCDDSPIIPYQFSFTSTPHSAQSTATCRKGLFEEQSEKSLEFADDSDDPDVCFIQEEINNLIPKLRADDQRYSVPGVKIEVEEDDQQVLHSDSHLSDDSHGDSDYVPVEESSDSDASEDCLLLSKTARKTKRNTLKVKIPPIASTSTAQDTQQEPDKSPATRSLSQESRQSEDTSVGLGYESEIDDDDEDVVFIRVCRETEAALNHIVWSRSEETGQSEFRKKIKLEDSEEASKSGSSDQSHDAVAEGPESVESENSQSRVQSSPSGNQVSRQSQKKLNSSVEVQEHESDKVAHGTSQEDDEEGDNVLSEKDILRDNNVPAIFIKKVLKSYTVSGGGEKKKKNNRVITSNHACYYCGVLRTHIQDHLLRKHADESDVKRIKNMLPSDKKSPNWQKEQEEVQPYMDMLRAMGDNEHNKMVLEKQKGQMLLYRRPTANFDHREYGPCPKCLLWLRRNSLSKHQKTCPGYKTEPEPRAGKKRKRELQMQSDILLGKITVNGSDLLKKEVFSMMKVDDVAKVAKNDALIVALGETWLRTNYSNLLKRKYYVSQHMRLAARLLMAARKVAHEVPVVENINLKGDQFQMWDLIRPAYFDVFVKAAFEISLPEIDDEEMLKSPSNCIAIKYDLIRMAQSKKTIARKEYDKDKSKKHWKVQRTEALEFLDDVDDKWSVKVTRQARTILAERRLNRIHTLPKPEDIEKLGKYLVAKLTDADLSEECVTWDRFRTVMRYVQARLLLYNKRRSGELEAVLLESYLKRRPIADIDAGLMGDLNATEKHLLESQDLVETRGKGGRPVPVLIPNECRKPLSFISKPSVRKSAGIREDNKYLFPNHSDGILNAYKSLKHTCSELDLVTPERITSVAMRKYMATLSQVLNLTTNELEWVCRHLGHTKTVHLEHYRQTSPFIERVNIGKILVMQDLNVQGSYVGRTLDSVDFSDILSVAENSEQFVLDQPETSAAAVQKSNKPATSNTSQVTVSKSNDNFDDEDQLEDLGGDNSDVYEGMRITAGDGDGSRGLNAHVSQETVTLNLMPKKKKRKPAVTGPGRQPWTEEEVDEIKKYLKVCFEEKRTPGRKACAEAIRLSKKNGGQLHLRRYTLIVKKVSNMLKKANSD